MAIQPNDIVAFNDSLSRCLSQPEFLDPFYGLFLGSSPEVAVKFEGTDFGRQKRMLTSSLYMMIIAVEGEESALPYLEKIAARHSRTERDIRPEMYDLWLESLVRAAREYDTEFDETLESVWRSMMQFGIDFMRERY